MAVDLEGQRDDEKGNYGHPKGTPSVPAVVSLNVIGIARVRPVTKNVCSANSFTSTGYG